MRQTAYTAQGDDKSAAGFEKILASLADKINKVSAKDARLRSQQRRFKALWTLYSTFAYIVGLTVQVVWIGRAWNLWEIGAVVVSPLVIYAIRLTIDTLYNYRISGTAAQLDELYKQRSDTVTKLKAATKYDSTQQLLDKYGGQGPKAPKTPNEKKKGSSDNKPAQPQVQRTGIPPPATANIPNRNQAQPASPQQQRPTSPVETTAEFAPNAFSPSDPFQGPFTQFSHSPTDPSQSPQQNHTPIAARSAPPLPASYQTARSTPSWTDRILDLVLGEDETQPRNRMALICAEPECRMVNGQAPPGTRSVADVGRWRCMRCGKLNGTESAIQRAVRDEGGTVPATPGTPTAGKSEVKEEAEEDEDDESDDVQAGMVDLEEDKESAPAKSSGRATRSGAQKRTKRTS